MKILLYDPDNGVRRNFMPHLWMFLLQALTPPQHEVVLIDANARPMSDDEIVQFVREQKIDLVGIGAMTRMAEKAYRVADAIRLAGVRVVMGGPHVTEVPDEALSQTTRRAWIKVFFENRRTVLSLAKEAIGSVLTSKRRMEGKDGSSAVINTA